MAILVLICRLVPLVKGQDKLATVLNKDLSLSFYINSKLVQTAKAKVAASKFPLVYVLSSYDSSGYLRDVRWENIKDRTYCKVAHGPARTLTRRPRPRAPAPAASSFPAAARRLLGRASRRRTVSDARGQRQRAANTRG